MSRTLTDPSGGNTINRVLPIYNGGSAEITAPDALDAFNGVPSADYNQPNGVASLNSLGKLPFTILPPSVASAIALEGPALLYTGSKGVWRITNFDSQLAYTVSCTAGFVAYSEEQIYYTAPMTPGVHGFVINDKAVEVTVDDHYIAQPAITSPMDRVLVNSSGMIVTADDFNIQGGFVETLITASDKAANDQFGTGVALSADGLRLAVGARQRVSGGLANSGAVYHYTRATLSSAWVQESILTAADKVVNDYFGQSVVFDSTATRMAVGAFGKDPGGISSAGAVYIYTRSGSVWTQETILTASDKAIGDSLGVSITMTSNGDRIAVGAQGRDTGGLVNSGAVYHYTRTGVTWTQESVLTALDKETEGLYGGGVALTGDGTYLAVSAHGMTISGVAKAGKLYFYTRSGSVWTQVGTLLPSVPQSSGYFGNGITLSPDGTKLLIGSHGQHIDNITNAGYITAYVKNNGNWIECGTVTASDRDMGDGFGTRIDITPDGSILATSSFNRDSGNIIDSGQVYIYDMSYHDSTDWQLATEPSFATPLMESLDDTVNLKSWPITGLALDTEYFIRCRYNGTAYGSSEWSAVKQLKTRGSYLPTNEVQKLIQNPPVANNWYGYGIAISEDGLLLAVGAHGADPSNISNAGSVYIYTRASLNATWALTQTLTSSALVAEAQFGVNVSITSDKSRLAISAFTHTESGASQCGAVYVFRNDAGTWEQEAKLIASDRAADDRLGQWMALSGDGTRIVTTAYLADVSGQVNAGATYIFSRSGTVWTQEQKITLPSPFNNDQFGTGVAIDTDGARIAIGCHLRDAFSIADSGLVVTYTRSGTVWTLEASLINSDSVTVDYFGSGLAMTPDGSRLAIGCVYKDTDGVTNSGAIYVFTRSGSTWTQEAKIVTSDKAIDDYFGNWTGIAISADGDLIVGGCFNKDVDGLTNAGATYLFKRVGSVWTQEAILTASDKAANDEFGKSVTITPNGSVLLIGSSANNANNVVDSGAVYIFQ